MNMPQHDIIVIGASAGGVEALQKIVRDLPGDLAAAVFVVLHVSENGTSVLPAILSREGVLPVRHAQNGETIEPGTIYVAPPGQHLIIKPGSMTLSKGPRENGFRPAVDTLFRTASDAYGPRVVGVVLTGLLDDGSAGLITIKAKGGMAVVQDPVDADFPSMPEHALKVVRADYVLPLSQIASTLVTLSQQSVRSEEPPMKSEKDSAESGTSEGIYDDKAGTISNCSCPECGGVLVEYQIGENGNLLRFKCRVGHAYSMASMVAHHTKGTEAALWASLRALQESISLSQRMAKYAQEFEDDPTQEMYEQRAASTERHAAVLRELLLSD